MSDSPALALAGQYGVHWVGGTVEEPEVTYMASGAAHTLWCEEESYKAKWVAQDHLAGVVLGDLGEENAGVWTMLTYELR